MSPADTFDKISLLRLAFNGLKDEELREMAKLSQFRTYPAEHILCQEGAEEDVFYIIADGSVVDYSVSNFIPGYFNFHVIRRVGNG